MDPISTALGAGLTAKSLLGGMVDRWRGVEISQMDEKAMVRLLVLECRRNLAVLDVAIGRKEPLSAKALWLVPAVLQTDALEAVLGQGQAAAGAFKLLGNLKSGSELLNGPHAGILANIYVRITALQSLCAINDHAPLSRVKIKLRLTTLRADLKAVLVTLAPNPAARAAAV
jgi:hypothetical protein